VNNRYLIHAALSGLLALPDARAEAIIEKLSPNILLHLEERLIDADEDLLWLRDVMAAGCA